MTVVEDALDTFCLVSDMVDLMQPAMSPAATLFFRQTRLVLPRCSMKLVLVALVLVPLALPGAVCSRSGPACC